MIARFRIRRSVWPLALTLTASLLGGCDLMEADPAIVTTESALATSSSSLGNSLLGLYAFGARTSVSPTCWQGTASATAQALPAGATPCPWVAETASGQYLTPYPAAPTATTPTTAAYDALRTRMLARYVTDPDPYPMRGGGDRNPSTPAFDGTGPEMTFCGSEQVVHNRRDGVTPVARVMRLGDGVIFPKSILNRDSGTLAMWIKAGRPASAWDWMSPVLYYFALANGDALYKPTGWLSGVSFANANRDATGTGIPYDNIWHHVLVTWSGDQATVYTDGAYTTSQRATRAQWTSDLASPTFPYAFFGAAIGCTPGVAPCDHLYMKDAIALGRTVNDDEVLQICANGRAGIVASPAPRQLSVRLTGALRTVSAQSLCDANRVVQKKVDAAIEIRGASRTEFSASATGTLWTGRIAVERLASGAWTPVAGCAVDVTATSFSEHVSLPLACTLDPTSSYRLRLTRLTSARGAAWGYSGGTGAPFVSLVPWLDGVLGSFGAPDTTFPVEACDRTARIPEPWLPIERPAGLYAVTVSTNDPIGLGRRDYQWTTPNMPYPQLFPQRITTTTRQPGLTDFATPEDVLAAPMRLTANGMPVKLVNIAWNMAPKDPGADRVVLALDGSAAGVPVHIDTTIDYDGQIWSKVTIPSGATTLTQLSLSLELNPALVTHLHTTVPVGTPGSATTPYYTHTSGELASIVGTGTYTSSWGQQPLVWLGAPRGGIQLTTADTASWYGAQNRQIAITRTSAGAVTLTLNFLQERPPVDQLGYTVGILATPVRAYAPGSRDRQLRMGGSRNIDGLNPSDPGLGAWNAWDRAFSMGWNRTSDRPGTPRWGYLRSTDYTYRDLATRGPCRAGGYSTSYTETATCLMTTTMENILRIDATRFASVPRAAEAIANQRNFYWNDAALQPQGARSQFLYWSLGNVYGGDPALELAGPEWDVRPSSGTAESTEYPGATHAIASQNDFLMSEASRLLTQVRRTAVPPMAGYHDTSVVLNSELHDLIGGYYLDVTSPSRVTSQPSPGRLVEHWTVEGTRDLLKRFYQLDRSLAKSNLRTIVNHTSDGSNASNLGFAHMNVTGEHQFAGYHFCSGATIRDSYRNLLTPERLRAEFTGRRIGTETAFLPEFANSIVADIGCASYVAPYAAGRGAIDWFWSNGAANAPSDGYRFSEHLAGLLMAHDIAVWNVNQNPFPEMRLGAVRERFGWTDDVSFIGYWENLAAWTPFYTFTASGGSISPSGIEDTSRRFMSLYGHTAGTGCGRKVLLVAMNDTAETATFSNVRIDWGALGLVAPTAAPTDPYHAPSSPFRPHWLPGGVLDAAPAGPTGTAASGYQFTVAPWNFRVIALDARAAKCP